MNYLLKFLVVLRALTLSLASSASAQTTLRWKFTPGQVLNQTSTQEVVTSANIGGKAIDTTVTQTVDIVWAVKSVDAQGKAEISQNIPRVRLKIVSPVLGTQDVDTTAEGNAGNPVANQLKALTKSQFTFSMNNLGEVSNIQVSTPNENPGAGGALSQMFGKEGLVSLIKQSMLPLPSEVLQKGSKWNRKVEVDVPTLGKVTATTALTYLGTAQVEGKTLEQVETDTVTEVGAKDGNPAAQLSIKEQTDKGTMYFDNVAGRFSHSESVQTMKMQVAAAGEMTVKTVKKSSLVPTTK